MDSIQQYKALMTVYVCTHQWRQFYKNENGYYFPGAKKYTFPAVLNRTPITVVIYSPSLQS